MLDEALENLRCLFVTSYMEHTATTFWARASIERSHKEHSQRSKEDIVHYALAFTATEHFLNNASTVTIQAPVTQEGRDRHGHEGGFTSVLVGGNFTEPVLLKHGPVERLSGVKSST